MQTLLIVIACIWFFGAMAFLSALGRAARRPIPSPDAENIPDTSLASGSSSSGQDDFGDYQKAARTVVIPTSAPKPALGDSDLREAPHGAS